MSSPSPAVPPLPSEKKPTAGIFGMFNAFLDPQATAAYVPLQWSWLWPLLLFSIVIGVTTWLNVPLVGQVMQRNPPGNMTAEQLERSMPMILMVQKAMAFVMPVFLAAMTALSAGLLSAACAVLDVRSRYRDNFALISVMSVISSVGVLAGFIVLRLKGSELNSMKELRPGFGLDLLLPETVNKFAYATANYFSIFVLWYIVMMALSFAALYGTSKGKGFAATAPGWILGLFLVLIGAIFQS